ncbi:hypothetical protein MTR67_017463 [Solanum verrucosum]|uniref:CCHC-type domain-containing protein n=1 Tax=Solanum verrucosum TaxID=315347 RepID=A0AAF0QKH2_SOLVR|nr:hypothetical protein MTR67_017463 [Solanum verrucosum]
MKEDPQEFIDEVSKVMDFVGVTMVEKVLPFREKKCRIDYDNSPQERFSGQGPSWISPRFNNERVSNPKSQEKGSRPLFPTCANCGKRNKGECPASANGCFGCGKSGHKIRDCPVLNAKGREDKQAPPRGSGTSAPRQEIFYALKRRGEQECPLEVGTGIYFVLYLIPI